MILPKLDKTETSAFTLFSLYILMNQVVHTLTGKEEDIHKIDFETNDPSFRGIVNGTVREALEYQILLKACAYMDEWNDIFGVRTEAKDKKTIDFIKTVTKPAHKAVSSWKGLRDFRNQAIAHNHRDKRGANIYLEPREYHSPETFGEIVFLVFCLEKMTDVILHHFPHVPQNIIENKERNKSITSRKFMTKKEIKSKMNQIENSIGEALMRNAVFSAMVEGLSKR